jgi:hypothetical protein
MSACVCVGPTAGQAKKIEDPPIIGNKMGQLGASPHLDAADKAADAAVGDAASKQRQEDIANVGKLQQDAEVSWSWTLSDSSPGCSGAGGCLGRGALRCGLFDCVVHQERASSVEQP